MCAYASTVLMACLHRMGIKQAVLVANHEHAHVRIRNRIIDITATQFWTGEDVRDRVEIASLTSLKARYTRDPQAWDAEWTFQSIDDAFDALHPASQNGFCEGQYWKTRSAMYRAIAQALHFCASRGLAQVGGPECSNADLACARRLKI